LIKKDSSHFWRGVNMFVLENTLPPLARSTPTKSKMYKPMPSARKNRKSGKKNVKEKEKRGSKGNGK
jgi:hypothetical protein